MIYVAWSDGGLADEELAAIAAHLGEHPRLPLDVRDEIAAWLDPNDPPTAGELALLLERVRSRSGDLDQAARQTLRELGHELAESAGHAVTADELGALDDLEDAVGLSGDERAASILWPIRPPAIEDSRPSVDLSGLKASLAAPHAELRREVLEFIASSPVPPDLLRPQYRAWVHGRLAVIAERGWGRLAYPPSTGGGGDLSAFLAVFETLGYGDLSVLVKYGVQFGLYGLAIAMLGTESHHAEYLASAGRLETAGCFAMTETAHGSNVADLETTAVYDASAGEFVINTPRPAARKDYIGNAANYAHVAVVFAKLVLGEHDHGVHGFVVPLREPSGRILPGRLIEECGEKLGLEGVDNGRISFNQVRIPRAALLDRFASISVAGDYESEISSPGRRFFTMLGTLVGGRIAVASAAVSASKLALTIAVRYAHRRRQFGPRGESELRLIDYPHHRRRLLPLLAGAIAHHAAVRSLGARFASGSEDSEVLETDVAAIKALATWHASETIGECREACGGRGYLAESRFAQLKADTDVFTTFEGDNTVLLQLVAKSLLSNYARGMRDLGVVGLARFVAERAANAFDRNPFVIRKTGGEHLRDGEFQGEILAARTRDLLHSLAARMKKRIDAGIGSFHALVECQSHAMSLARSHAEERAHASLREFEAEQDGDSRHATSLLRALYGLHAIERGGAWFLENGYLEPTKAAAIRDQVDSLCTELAPPSRELVDAIGIPDDVVGAPIGRTVG